MFGGSPALQGEPVGGIGGKFTCSLRGDANASRKEVSYCSRLIAFFRRFFCPHAGATIQVNLHRVIAFATMCLATFDHPRPNLLFRNRREPSTSLCLLYPSGPIHA